MVRKAVPRVSKKTVSKKAEEAPKVVVEKVEPVLVQASNAEQMTESSESNDSSVTEILNCLIQETQEITNRQKTLTQQLKSFSRAYKKELKELKKCQVKSKKVNKKDPNRPKRAPSGFAVPSEISAEMCKFLGLAQGSQLSRTDVTRKLTSYIREKNLQIPQNRRSFNPDKALGGILGPLQEMDKDKGYTYFNLQRYITPHIISNSASS